MEDWAKPNNFGGVFRLTSSKYANDFIKKGSIKFNTPQSWIDYYKEHGAGRGDAYEGTIAFCDIFDIAHIDELYQKYNSNNILNATNRQLITGIDKQRLYFKDELSLQLPCFCVYIVKNSLFPVPNSEGIHKLAANIPASYFRDFSDNETQDNVNNLPLEDQPALIFISDFDKFKDRLHIALKSLGLNNDEILIGTVSYFDFEQYGVNGWMDFGQRYPKELLIKNKRFEEQSEARVIIKTSKSEIIKQLHDVPIELGCMEDIAQVYKGYLYEGVHIESTVNVCQE